MRIAFHGDKWFLCDTCRRNTVHSDCVTTGIVVEQEGFLIEGYAITNKRHIIVFAICRKCCDKFTFTKIQWRVAYYKSKAHHIWWQVKQLYNKFWGISLE
jgi:hypothetical protein